MNEETIPGATKKVLGPGRLLRIAREEKNLRPEDIAYEIRLTPSQVLALDEDDYSKMPEETYVRGYLRNYARLVGVPENEILMAFARFTRKVDETPTSAALPIENKINRDKNSKIFWIVAVAGIAAVIAFSTLWVLDPNDEPSPAVGSSDALVVDEKPDIEEVPVGTSTLKLGTAVIGGDKNNSSDSAVNEERATEKHSGTEGATVSPALVKQDGIKLPVQTSSTSNEITKPDGGVLIIKYKKDSWTDVRDANGAKLLYRTVKAGEKVALAGKLPISIFFGFAQGVDVKFNGKTVDISAHTRGVFARFTVGETVNQ